MFLAFRQALALQVNIAGMSLREIPSLYTCAFRHGVPLLVVVLFPFFLQSFCRASASRISNIDFAHGLIQHPGQVGKRI